MLWEISQYALCTMRDALCSIHYQSRACRRAWGLLSISLAAPPRLTKYRVRVRVGLNCGAACSGDPLGRETKRASLGASVPPCRLAALPPALLETGRRCAQVARDGRAVHARRPRRPATDGSAGEAAGHMHAATPLTSPPTTTTAAGRARAALQVPGRLNTGLRVA